jgi:hypothetical protein
VAHADLIPFAMRQGLGETYSVVDPLQCASERKIPPASVRRIAFALRSKCAGIQEDQQSMTPTFATANLPSVSRLKNPMLTEILRGRNQREPKTQMVRRRIWPNSQTKCC